MLGHGKSRANCWRIRRLLKLSEYVVCRCDISYLGVVQAFHIPQHIHPKHLTQLGLISFRFRLLGMNIL